MSVSSLALDIIVLAIFVICIFYYRAKGLLGSLVDLFGTIGCVVASWIVSGRMAPRIFNEVFRPRIEQEVFEAMAQQTSGTINDLLTSLFGWLPQETVESMTLAVEQGAGEAGANIGKVVVDSVVAPIVTPLITIVVFIALFFVLRLLLSLVAKLLGVLAKAPVVNGANKLLGMVVGVIMACLYTFLILCIIWGIDAVMGGEGFGSVYFSQSIVHKLTYWMNVFA